MLLATKKNGNILQPHQINIRSDKGKENMETQNGGTLRPEIFFSVEILEILVKPGVLAALQ
jgi:hypothetical protein